MNLEDYQRIEAYLDDTLNAEELKHFKNELEHNAELRRELALAVKIKGLAAIDPKVKEWDKADQVLEGIQHMSLNSIDEKVMTQLSNSKPKVFLRKRSWGLLLAAQIVLTVLLSYIIASLDWGGEGKRELLGHIHNFEGRSFMVRNEEKIRLSEKLEIYHGDQLFVEEEGHILFEYLDGSEIKFLNYSYAQLNNSKEGKRILLFSGALTGDIETQLNGKPLKVITEHSESVVLGTKIEINSSDLSTLLQVKEGEVKMVPRNNRDGEGLLVGSSQYAVGKRGKDVSLHEIKAPLMVSDTITKDTPGHGVEVDVELHGAEKIYLVVTNAKDGIPFDHAGWVEPTIYDANGEYLLSDKEWTFESCGWMKSRVNRGYHREEVYVDGVRVDDVIVTHANSIIIYDLAPGAKRFTAKAALLKSGLEQKNSKSSVTFEVYTDIPEEKLKALVRDRNAYLPTPK